MKRPILAVLVISLVVLASSSTLAAVDSVDILIKALVDRNIITEDDATSVRAEIAGIRQEEEAKKKSFAVSGKRPIKLSGYLQERYTHSTQSGVNDTFEARRVRLSLAGDAAENVDFKVQVDFAGSRKGVADATLKSGALTTKTAAFSKPVLLDAVVGYKLPNESKLSFGQFKLPFGLENLTSSTNLDTINRSLVTESLVPGRDTGNQGRDVGVQWNGTKPLGEEGGQSLEYYVGVFNGSGINVGDDNARKDPSARLVWNFGPSNAHLGAAYFDGAVGPGKAAHKRTGAELVYILGPYALRSEYIWARDAAIKKNGWYATVVRQWSESVQGVVRYDRIDPNTADGGDKTETWTFGLNKFLTKDGYTRWQVNYETRRGQGTQPSYDQFLAQFQAGF